MAKPILFMLTSTRELGDTGKEMGFHWKELSTPYWILRDAGFDIELASIRGGKPPADPSSADSEERPESTDRFMNDEGAMAALENTMAVGDVDPSKYDAIYLPGGHGTMWDFRQCDKLGPVISKIWADGGLVASVCHGPAALLGATKPDGSPLVNGQPVNGFTDAEEHKVGLEDVVPFLLETELRKQGAVFEHSDAFAAHVAQGDRLFTGQNPASAEPLGHAIAAFLAADARNKAA